jgi:NAD(P)H-flavin reductase
MLVNEYKLYVSIQRSSKDAKFGQYAYVQIWGSPFLISRTDAQNGVEIIFKLSDFHV